MIKYTKRSAMLVAVVASSLMATATVASYAGAASVYAPSGVTGLDVTNVSGKARTISVAFTSPSDAVEKSLVQYRVEYTCVAASPAVAGDPCDGTYKLIELYSVTGTIANRVPVTLGDYTLPAGIAGTSGRNVTIRVTPVGGPGGALDGDSSVDTIGSIDTPVLVATPLSTRSLQPKQITVQLPSTVVDQWRGSTLVKYYVEYSRTNVGLWTKLEGAGLEPSGGWAPGKSLIITVPLSGVPYYFRVVVVTDAGTVVMNPSRSQIARS